MLKWIALAVIVVIALILIYGSEWRVHPGVSYANGVTANNSQGNFQSLGVAADAGACQSLCGDANWCRAYTWTQDPAGDHSCIGLKNPQTAKMAVGGNYTSGDRVTGWGAKLMHNLGMESAGTSAASKESFNRSVVAPDAGLELFSDRRLAAPQTGLELFSDRRLAAPDTGLELFSDRRLAAPDTGLELFGGRPGAGTFYADYM